MSKSSIYETTWLDLVFEGKNKEYGAYQLRRENAATTLKALAAALLLVTFLVIVSVLAGSFKTTEIPQTDYLGPTIHTVDVIQPIEPPKQQPPKANALPPAKIDDPKPTLQNPDIVKPAQATPDVPTNNDFSNSNASPNGVNGGTGTIETSASGGTETPTTAEPGSGNSTYVTAAVDKMPTYPGGMDGFYKFVGRNFRAPEDALASGSTVKVLVSFVIEKDGTMTDIKVNRNPGYGLDKEAIRVLKSMKVKWEPGSIKGQPVRVLYSLPIAVKVP